MSAFEDEANSTFVGSESRVHVGVAVECLQDGDAYFLNVDEVKRLLNHNMLRPPVFSRLHFVYYHFSLFREEYFELLFGQIGKGEEGVTKITHCRLAGCSFMSCSFYFLQHLKFIIQIVPMSDQYIQNAEEMQALKKEASTWKQRNVKSESELNFYREKNAHLKQTIERLQEQNGKLLGDNRQLQEARNSLLNDYTSQLEGIKLDIIHKENEIRYLKEQSIGPILNETLLKKQLIAEFENTYEEKMAGKNKKIQELTNLLERNARDREMDRQKHQYRVDGLEAQLKVIQETQFSGLQMSAERIYQQNKPTDDKEASRKFKREVEELRRKLDTAQEDLQDAIQEKNKLQKEYNAWLEEHQAYVAQTQEEIRTLRQQCLRTVDGVDRTHRERDTLQIREKEREVRKMRNELEEVRDTIMKKDKKLLDLEVECKEYENELKKIRSGKESTMGIEEIKLRGENQKLLRQLGEYRSTVETLRIQVRELTVEDSSRRKQSPEIGKKMGKDTPSPKSRKSKQNDASRKLRENGVSPQFNEFLALERQNYDARIAQQKAKTKYIAERFIELKRKYVRLEGKFREANSKVVELLKGKLQLTSQNQGTVSNINLHHLAQADLNRQFYEKKKMQFQTHTQQVIQNCSHEHHMRNRRNRDGMSPQNATGQGQRRSTSSNGNSSFYEKSLKMKNASKFKISKCSNHEEIAE